MRRVKDIYSIYISQFYSIYCCVLSFHFSILVFFLYFRHFCRLKKLYIHNVIKLEKSLLTIYSQKPNTHNNYYIIDDIIV